MITTISNASSSKKVLLQVVFIIFLIFLAFTRWIPGGDSFNPESGTRAWIEMSLVALALFATIVIWGPRQLFSGIGLPSFAPLILFCIWAMITAFWSQNPILAVGKGLELLILSFVAISISYQCIKAGVSLPRILLFTLLLIIVFMLFINLVYYGKPFPMVKYGTRMRFVLGYMHPNSIAIIFSSTLLISLYLLLFERKKKTILFLIFVILIAAILIYLTNSRTTMLGAIIAGALIFIFKIKNKTSFAIFLILIIILFTATLFLLSSGFLDSQVNDFLENHPDYLTLNGRTPLWIEAMNNLKGSNLFGNGYFNTRFLFIGELNQSWAFQSHNSLIEVFFSTGFIGLVFATLFFIFSFMTSHKNSVFPLSLVYLLYITLESTMETHMFVPNIPMFILMTLIFTQQLSKREQHDSNQLPTS